MSNEVIFAKGLIFKMPRQGAPDFVKGSLSFKVDEIVDWLKEHEENGWVNVNLKVSRAGKPYADLDNWKPDGGYSKPIPAPKREESSEDDITF